MHTLYTFATTWATDLKENQVYYICDYFGKPEVHFHQCLFAIHTHLFNQFMFANWPTSLILWCMLVWTLRGRSLTPLKFSRGFVISNLHYLLTSQPTWHWQMWVLATHTSVEPRTILFHSWTRNEQNYPATIHNHHNVKCRISVRMRDSTWLLFFPLRWWWLSHLPQRCGRTHIQLLFFQASDQCTLHGQVKGDT